MVFPSWYLQCKIQNNSLNLAHDPWLWDQSECQTPTAVKAQLHRNSLGHLHVPWSSSWWPEALDTRSDPRKTTQTLDIMQPFIGVSANLLMWVSSSYIRRTEVDSFTKGSTDTHNNIETCVHTQTRTQNSPGAYKTLPFFLKETLGFKYVKKRKRETFVLYWQQYSYEISTLKCNSSHFQKRLSEWKTTSYNLTGTLLLFHANSILSLKDSGWPWIRHLWNQNPNCLEILCS